jgi:predicted alpha/beta-hydrolase family hydrolase
MLLAHIAGLPIEETALSFGPVIAAGGGIATLRLRERFARGRPRGRRADSPRRTSTAPGHTRNTTNE